MTLYFAQCEFFQVIGIKGARVAILCERQHSACPLILLRFKMLEDKITDYSRAALWFWGLIWIIRK